MIRLLRGAVELVLVLALLAAGAWGVLTTWPSLLGAEMARHERVLRGWLEAGRACRPEGRGAGPYGRVFDHLVALEDRSFSERSVSVNVRGVARAVVRNVAAGAVQEGGSGLPQQLATLAMAEVHQAWTAHDLAFKLRQFVLASRVFHDVPRSAWEVAWLDHMPCGPVSGARACSLYVFGSELSAGDPALDLKAAILAALVQAPVRLHADPDELVDRARYARRLAGAGEPIPVPASVTEGRRFRRLATALRGRSVCEAGGRGTLAGMLPALGRGVEAGQAAAAGREEGVTVIAALLAGDAFLPVAGDWTRFSFGGGSWAKVWTLDAIAGLGPEYLPYLTRVRLRPGIPVWDLRLRRWRPRSVGRLKRPVPLAEAVARSHNSASLTYLYFPYWLDGARLSRLLPRFVTEVERRRYTTRGDRRRALRLLSSVTGYPYSDIPEEADPAFVYRPLLLLSLRMFARAVERDLPGADVPETPAALLGAGFSATPEQWLRALSAVWFSPQPGCHLSPTGEVLARQMAKAGTLHRVLGRLDLTAPGKTGTAESNAQAAVGLCLAPEEGRPHQPAVLACWAFHPDWRPLRRLQGSDLSACLRAAVEGLRQGREGWELAGL